MSTPSVTHTFVAGSTAKAVEVNENFNDILSFIQANVIVKDASVAFTAVPSGPASDPVSPNQLARKAYVDAVVAPYAPVGLVLPFAGSTAPTGWLLCDGSAVSRVTYASLFGVIGTSYGAGDGATTFNLPDTRGRTLVGVDGLDPDFDARGKTGGVKSVTLTTGQLPSHTHTTPNHNHSFSATTGSSGAHTHTTSSPGYIRVTANVNAALEAVSPASGATSGNPRQYITVTDLPSDGAHTHTVSGTSGNASPTTNATGSGEAHTNVQPFVTVNHIIRH